jgi:hypothetical protein
MRARLHRFLLMLLMLVLPLQALASAAMLDCMHSHSATAEPMATADEMAMPDGMAAACHEQSHSDGAPAARHDCKHCAACALASALPAPSSGAPAVLPHPTRFAPHAAESFSGFIPDGPERPPRTSLA